MRRLLIALLLLAPSLAPAAGTCPLPGDLAPGVLDATTSPPTWRAQGDGMVTVADVVALLRASVGLQSVAPSATCTLRPGDLSPGWADARTVPATWRPVGNDRVDISDVVAGLRAAVGLHDVERPGPLTFARLRKTDGCEDLLQWIRRTAHGVVDQGGLWSWRWWGPADIDGDGVPTAGGAGAPGGGAREFSGTNTQEAGVDEMDFVKNDGAWLHVLGDGRVRVLRAWPAESLALVAEIPVEGQGLGLFLVDDRLIVLSAGESAPPAAAALGLPLPMPSGNVKVTIADVSDPRFPRVLRETWVDGWLQAARIVDGRLVLVLYHALAGPALPAPGGDWEAWRTAVRAAIDASTLEDWMPRALDVRHVEGEARATRAFVIPCDRVRRPDDAGLPGLVSVTTLDLAGTAPPAGAAVASQAQTAYVSADMAVVATSWWGDGFAWSAANESTRLHAFDLADAQGLPAWRGSGVVGGSLVDSFSLDEEEGRIRVATSNWWRENGEPAPVSHVRVLEQPAHGQDYEVVGAVENLAPGERLFSARFLQDRAYLVTFLRKDPLFTIDLSTPRTPRLAGALDVTGWSSYLHPLSDGRLLGIGEEVDPDSQAVLGVQVSYFDVRSLATPSLLDREILTAPYGSSEAAWDHHAFTFYEPLSALAVPVVDAGWDPFTGAWVRAFNGLRVFRVTPVDGILPIGTLSMPALPGEDELASPWCSQVKRSVFLEDRLFAISESGVTVAPLGDLAHPLAHVSFDRPECWCGCPYDGTSPGGGAP